MSSEPIPFPDLGADQLDPNGEAIVLALRAVHESIEALRADLRGKR